MLISRSIPILRGGVIVLVCTFVLTLLVVSRANAKTELEKFMDTIPIDARHEFVRFKACATLEWLKLTNKQQNVTFEEIETAIESEITCQKNLGDADRELTKFGFSVRDRGEIINRFSSLAKTERRLGYEKLPIPGYKEDPSVTRTMRCVREIDLWKDAYSKCINNALQGLIPYSNDPSDAVADAAMGVCDRTRNDITTNNACSWMDRAELEKEISSLSQKLRSLTLGKAAALRAEMLRRQLTPKLSPAPFPPSTPPERGI